jgi:hypothetical protein
MIHGAVTTQGRCLRGGEQAQKLVCVSQPDSHHYVARRQGRQAGVADGVRVRWPFLEDIVCSILH